MSKYIYFSDAHCKGVNPSSRIDNYYESWQKKFKETLKLAKKHKVDGIIDAGDLLDTPIIATTIVDDILDAIEGTGIPFYTIFGNHGMSGHHRETSNNTSMAHMLRRCKLMHEVKELTPEGAVISFVEYDHNIEQKIKDEGIEVDAHEDIWKVAIVHAFVTPKPFLANVLHVVADDIVTNANLVLVAHYHTPWNKKVGNTEYLDIGAFGRCSIAEADIEPSVLLIDTKKRSYEIIKLTSAKPGAEVFNLSKKETKDSNEVDLDLFISSLKDFKTQSLDLQGVIEQIGKEQNIEREIIDLILKKLGEVNV